MVVDDAADAATEFKAEEITGPSAAAIAAGVNVLIVSSSALIPVSVVMIVFRFVFSVCSSVRIWVRLVSALASVVL